MIKKIANWTFGSVFRTFGRIIAYLIFGIALSYILSSLDFRITDLFFDNVKADTLNTFNTGGWAGWPDSTAFGSQYSEARIDNPTYVNSIFNPSNTLSNISGINKIQITGYFYYLDLDDSFSTTCTQYDNNYGCLAWNYYTGNIQQFSFQLWTNTRTEQCQLTFNGLDNSFRTESGRYVFWEATCNASALNNIQLLIEYTNEDWGNDHHPKIGINKYVKYWRSDSSSIIDNQNQNTQSIIQQQQNNTQQILDSNTTQAENDAQGFFDDFDVPDVGGLSAIITAPLNTIRSLLSSTCSKLVLPLPYVNENLELPCMNEIYTQHFGLFFSLYQTIMLAIISYRCIRSIYFDITGFTNPDDDRIEVMDL